MADRTLRYKVGNINVFITKPQCNKWHIRNVKEKTGRNFQAGRME